MYAIGNKQRPYAESDLRIQQLCDLYGFSSNFSSKLAICQFEFCMKTGSFRENKPPKYQVQTDI